MRFQYSCCWEWRLCAMWSSVVGRVVPDILKDHCAFSFMGHASSELLDPGRCGHCNLMIHQEKPTKQYLTSQKTWIKLIQHIHSFNHSIGMCRLRRFLAVLKSFFQSSLLCNCSCYPSPPTILPSSLISSCHSFLGLPLNLAVPKFIYNTLLGHGFWNFGILQPPKL